MDWKEGEEAPAEGGMILWIFMNQVTQGISQLLWWGYSAVQWQESKGSEHNVHDGIIAAGSVFFCVPKDSQEGLP